MKPFSKNRITIIATLVIAAAALFAACGDDAQEDGDGLAATSSTTPAFSTTSTTTTGSPLTLETTSPRVGPTEYAGFLSQPTACSAEPPPPAQELAFTGAEDQGLSGIITARIVTSCGEITIELDADAAPETVNSFVFLARQGYFDGTVSHRVLPGFVLQAGDPTGTGGGGPGYVVPDEFPAEPFMYSQGVLAMANAGLGTTGSQFFIMLADSGLPPLYSYFGRVVDGLGALEAVSSLPLGFNARTGEQSVPLETLYIEQVIIEE
jgi:cyclophilin family peptidyl-prolyl cis-trans isomerase